MLRNYLSSLNCIRPAVPERKTYPGAELILTPPATPEPVLIDEGLIGRHGQQHAERIQVPFSDGYI